MPLHWTIDSAARKVDVVSEGDVTMADVTAFFDAIEKAEALSYNKLFDGTRGRAAMTSEELMGLAGRIRDQHAMSVMGALAFVVTREQAEQIIRLLGAAAVADRPLKVFDDVASARRWLNAQPSRYP